MDNNKRLIESYVIKLKDEFCKLNADQTGKLRLYASFKNCFGRETYISVIDNFSVRKVFTSFRISSHQLEIETGRYRSIPVTDRKCKICNSVEVEDEIHFMFHCTKYMAERENFVRFINSINDNFSNLSDKDKLIWLMNNEDKDVIKVLSEYIYKCFKTRNSNQL